MTYFPEIATKKTVILEVTPSVTLSDWTVHSGSAYNVALSNTFNSELYRRVIGVRQNGTDLTEAASIAAVIAGAGTYFWDEANAMLYARATSGAISSYVAQAFVTYYFATDPVTLNQTDDDSDTGIYYSPWIISELPSLSRQASNVLFGITVTASGNVSFTNGHSHWHYLIPGHNWKNKKARILYCEYESEVTNRSDFTELITMLVEDAAADEKTAALKLVGMQRVLDRQLPVTNYTTDDYANLSDEASGTRKMLGWGRASVQPTLTNDSGNGVYTIADAAYQTLFAVHSVTAIAKDNGARTTLTVTTHYTVDLTLCTVTLTGTGGYTCVDYDIEVDVTGKPDGAGSYLKTAADIIEDILTIHLGFQAADLDAASFTQANLDNDHELSVWLKNPRSIASIFSSSEPNTPSIERSVLGTLRLTLDGKWNFKIWNDSDAAPTVTLNKTDFVSFLPQPKIETITALAVVYYNQNLSNASWKVQSTTDLRSQYLNETREESEFYSFLKNDDDALTLSQRAMLLLAASSIEVEFELRGSQLASTLAGDLVSVNFSPAPVIGQAFVDAYLGLQRLDIVLFPTLKLTGRLVDFRSVGNRVGHWTEDTAHDWATASDAEKADQGFWSDDAGLTDPSDPTTADLSLWW